MKEVYIATYSNGLNGPIRVFGSDTSEAKKAAYAAYTFGSAQWYPNHPVDEVVAAVELAPDQVMRGNGTQPCVSIDEYEPPTVTEILREQFGLNLKRKVADA